MTIIQKFLVCIKFGVDDQRDITYRSVCCVNNLVNLKFKDHFLINASADIPIPIHIAIHRYLYQLMGVFCDRHKLCSNIHGHGLAKTKADIANKSSHSCLSC